MLGKNPKSEFSKKKNSLSANPKHFSKEEHSLKLQDVIISYMQNERGRLGLDISHPGLLIIDVFRSNTTTTIKNLLGSNDIYFSKVRANMTNLY